MSIEKNATHPPKFTLKIIKIYFSFECKKDFVYEVILEFFNRFFKYPFGEAHPQKRILKPIIFITKKYTVKLFVP
jgi:hypothetical protein